MHKSPEAKPSRSNTDSARNSQDDAGARGAPAQREVPSPASPGTESSNTVPDKDNPEGNIIIQPFRWGVDSLYLSFKGSVFVGVEAELKKLKALAQSPNPLEVAKAQYRIGERIFQVKDRGAGLFPYILEDPAFRLQIPKATSKALPLAYVKLSSGYLASVAVEIAEAEARQIAAEFGIIEDAARVGRIDLFVDFVTGVNLEGWDRSAWVTRASAINNYSVDGRFTGWAIGVGGPIAMRLYDKTLEIQKSGKEYLKTLWREVGWNDESLVWRLEIQLKREVLSQLGLKNFASVAESLNGIWGYALTEWLRLTLPSASDHKRSRWPVHPLWAALASIDWETQGGPLLRQFPKHQAPSDEWLFSSGLRPIVAFMAKTGITDFQIALDTFQRDMVAFHEEQADRIGLRFVTYLREKVELKAREFCTIYNAAKTAEEERKRKIDAYAEEYRRQSDGFNPAGVEK